MSTFDPPPHDPRHISLGERLVDAWLRDDEGEWRAAANEIQSRHGDVSIVLEYVVGMLAVERVARLGPEEAITYAKAIIDEMSGHATPHRPHRSRIAHLIRGWG